MSTRKLHHPADASVVKTVPAAAAKSWEKAGWVPVADEPTGRAPAKKAASKKRAGGHVKGKPTPAQKVAIDAAVADTNAGNTPVLEVNHQHD